LAAIAEPSPEAALEEGFRLVAQGGKVTDKERLKRIQERSEQATREVFE
jgi:hypothetical protein